MRVRKLFSVIKAKITSVKPVASITVHIFLNLSMVDAWSTFWLLHKQAIQIWRGHQKLGVAGICHRTPWQHFSQGSWLWVLNFNLKCKVWIKFWHFLCRTWCCAKVNCVLCYDCFMTQCLTGIKREFFSNSQDVGMIVLTDTLLYEARQNCKFVDYVSLIVDCAVT